MCCSLFVGGISARPFEYQLPTHLGSNICGCRRDNHGSADFRADGRTDYRRAGAPLADWLPRSVRGVRPRRGLRVEHCEGALHWQAHLGGADDQGAHHDDDDNQGADYYPADHRGTDHRGTDPGTDTDRRGVYFQLDGDRHR